MCNISEDLLMEMQCKIHKCSVVYKDLTQRTVMFLLPLNEIFIYLTADTPFYEG